MYTYTQVRTVTIANTNTYMLRVQSRSADISYICTIASKCTHTIKSVYNSQSRRPSAVRLLHVASTSARKHWHALALSRYDTLPKSMEMRACARMQICTHKKCICICMCYVHCTLSGSPAALQAPGTWPPTGLTVLEHVHTQQLLSRRLNTAPHTTSSSRRL